MEEIFESSVRSNEDFAGVFEHDGDVGYFYLYKMSSEGSNSIADSIRICVGEVVFDKNAIHILWSKDENKVALKIDDIICAVFDINEGKKYGGDYSLLTKEYIPHNLTQNF